MRFAHLWALAAVWLFLAPQAQALQMRFQCRMPNGTMIQSDRPCYSFSNPGSASAGRQPPVYYGPTEPGLRYQPAPPSIGEAPDHITYMSPRCSGLHDALRTAAARGLASSTVSEMRRNYQRECAENEAEARTRYASERGEKRQLAKVEQASQQRAHERTKLQEQQCGESKRILVTKKARTDLNDGEKAELQRFETNYRARCS
ncbi:hypothetical protein [Caenimonas sp. SL110]|uniref:hypothetical protein n=1 Tax=Caenimonas sp. SL110 TaxID=1450524 RepID=UPI00128CCFC3|nr:hypothetical protein [Caenimonas sp. SL110]